MRTEYVSQGEIEAHEAAMRRVVEDEKKEQEVISDKKKRTIKDAGDKAKEAIKAADEDMRKAIEAVQKANDKAIKAAKKEEEDAIKVAEMLAEHKQKQATRVKNQKLAAMQRDFERLPLLRQVYHEAPDDVFELMVSKCSDVNEYGWGRGGLNSFRLACKRLKRVVESCTTVLTNRQADGPDSFPIPIIQRCGRIEDIRCISNNLRSLEGCPDGLKRLFISNASHVSGVSSLASCSMMKSLEIWYSSITDISVVSLMPPLEVFICDKATGWPLIKDISPLSSCPMLKEVWLAGNSETKDLSPLSALETLNIINCPLMTSLTPPSTLSSLKILYCYHIHPQTSLLPLATCTGLEMLYCSGNAVDLEELRRRRPNIKINSF